MAESTLCLSQPQQQGVGALGSGAEFIGQECETATQADIAGLKVNTGAYGCLCNTTTINAEEWGNLEVCRSQL